MKTIILFFTISIFAASCASKLVNNKKERLKQDLQKMVEIDQIAAYVPQGKYKNYTSEQWAKFQDSVFESNMKRVEKLYRKYGFLGFDKVGKDGSNHFWLLVQHCDKYPQFQKEVLSSMEKEIKKANANSNNYALLYDRVQINAGQKQLFGTQVTYEVETTGRAIPKIGLIDSANIDHLRKEYGLNPLKDYLNQMTTMHYEMNKERYEKKGILKPNLY